MRTVTNSIKHCGILFLILSCSLSACNKNSLQSDCSNSESFSVNEGSSCTQNPGNSEYNETINNGIRYITANGIADHLVGQFPNAHNPNSISAQNLHYTMPANPALAGSTTPLFTGEFVPGEPLAIKFGILTSGVVLDPIAAEPWINPNTRQANWSWVLEPLSTHNNLGVDCNNAHVQPNGSYHYHGTPHSMVEEFKVDFHSSLLGYAADGFPIYYKYVFSNPQVANSAIIEAHSSYTLKQGCRPGNGISAPDGAYDGTYVQDYEYQPGHGDLDECNGRSGITPEYPGGTYYYVITDEFPSIPRCFKGTPDGSFMN